MDNIILLDMNFHVKQEKFEVRNFLFTRYNIFIRIFLLNSRKSLVRCFSQTIMYGRKEIIFLECKEYDN